MNLVIDSEKINKFFYRRISQIIYRMLLEDIKNNINKKKYSIREKEILKSGVIQWDGKPPKSIDLVYYVTHCLELVYKRGCYVIQLNDRKIIPGSSTKVSTLIRLLEYGNEKITPYPYIRNFLMYYEDHYEDIAISFFKEAFNR